MISTGTVYSIDDVSTLALLPNIEGTIIGRALYQGKVELAEAIKIARESRVAPELAEMGVAPQLDQIAGIPINGITNVGVGISDIRRSVKFYEMLGFAKQEQSTLNKGDQVIMRHGSGVAINLVTEETNIQHVLPIALEVSSLTKTFASLEHNKIDIVYSYEDYAHRCICVKDPDNNLIELNHHQ